MSSLSSFGLSATGLSVPRQADFTADLQAQWQASFGQQVNLDPRSNNGQIINIMAERFALLAELLEGIYNASYPAGAEGVAVDNLLALQGLKRLTASATKTAASPVTASNGITAYGLVCYGTAGTVVPAGTLIADGASPADTFATDAAITIGAAQNALQTIVFNGQATAGGYTLTLTAPTGKTYTTPTIAYNATPRAVVLVPGGTTDDQDGVYTLTFSNLGTLDTSNLAGDGNGQLKGSDLAAAINTKFSLTTVTGSGDMTPGGPGVALDFGASPTPVITASGAYAPTVLSSIQSIVNGLIDATTSAMPFTDVAVNLTGNVLTLAFGAFSPAKGQPATAATPIALVNVASNTLQAGSTVINVAVSGTIAGQPAQGVGSATCTANGPVSVAAGQLVNIVTPISGFNSVTNQLDCVAGTLAETDVEALARRASLVASQAQGPLASILQRVKEASGVTAAIAVTNTSMASQQVVTVGSGGSTGSFALVLNGQTTTTLAYNATAAQVQTALRVLSGASAATVSGAAVSGLVVDWGVSNGGQALPLMSVANNTTGVTVTCAYGRYPKSVELVVEGGSNDAVAQAIFAAAPAGLATYGQPVLTTTVTTTASKNVATVLSTTGLVVGMGLRAQGIVPGTLVTGIAGNTLTLSSPALSSYSNTSATFGYFQPVTDANGYLQVVNFSRPTLVPLYVLVNLVTDLRTTPGDSASPANPSANFNIASVPAIQAAIVAVVNSYGIGSTLVASGTNGIASAFRSVAGIEDATVAFDVVSPPVNTARFSLQSEQVADLQLANVVVSYV